MWSGVEKVFERIALSVDKHIPKSENWHMELLLQMAKPFEKAREAIIEEELLEDLKEYLRFRHLFRHIYGFQLTFPRFKEYCINLEEISIKFELTIENHIQQGKQKEQNRNNNNNRKIIS